TGAVWLRNTRKRRSSRRSTDAGWTKRSSNGSTTMRPAATASRIERSDRITGAEPTEAPRPRLSCSVGPWEDGGVSVRAWVVVVAAAALLTATIALTYSTSQDVADPAPAAAAGALTPTDPDRIDATQQAAIVALRSAPTDPQPSGHGHGDLVRYDE